MNRIKSLFIILGLLLVLGFGAYESYDLFVKKPLIKKLEKDSVVFVGHFLSLTSDTYLSEREAAEKYMSFDLLKAYKKYFSNDTDFTKLIVNNNYKSFFEFKEIAYTEPERNKPRITVKGFLILTSTVNNKQKKFFYTMGLKWVKYSDGSWVIDNLRPEMTDENGNPLVAGVAVDIPVKKERK